MNRVEKDIIEINRLSTNGRNLHKQYRGKNKGSLYYAKQSLILDKVKFLKERLENFGKQEFNVWNIRYGDNNITNYHEITLASDITEEEVISYYEKMGGLTIQSIHLKEVKTIGFNFPRKQKQ